MAQSAKRIKQVLFHCVEGIMSIVCDEMEDWFDQGIFSSQPELSRVQLIVGHYESHYETLGDRSKQGLTALAAEGPDGHDGDLGHLEEVRNDLTWGSQREKLKK